MILFSLKLKAVIIYHIALDEFTIAYRICVSYANDRLIRINNAYFN